MAKIDAKAAVDGLLRDAVGRCASDVHVEPTDGGYDIRFRVDGLLETVRSVGPEEGRGYVNRLMVAAELLTYRLDVPQEGRCAVEAGPGRAVEARVAVMPTNHGLRAVVRLPAELADEMALEELGLPEQVMRGLRGFVAADSGMLILSGPAGSGKTTTVYALLREIVRRSPGLSVVALEDPVERDVAGVTQIEVRPFGELTYEKALRSMLRQDPQVLAIGEVRDAATASIAVQAALSGHRLVTTLHAGSVEGAVVRLLEMGLERYQVASAVHGAVALRLVRRRQNGGGYRGRAPIAEFAAMDERLRRAVLDGGDTAALRDAIEGQDGFRSLRDSAKALVDANLTDQAEIHRILGTPDQVK